MQSFRKLIADSYGPAGMDSSLGVLPFLAKEGVDQETALGLVMNFLAAGSDPPTKVLSWIMMFLAENPEIQSKIRDDPQDEIILNCIKETLRLKPPSLDVLAQVSDPNGFVLDGKTIPQGAVVMAFFRPLMVDSIEDGNEWKPSRWSDAKQATKLSKCLYSFGGGGRLCIGKQFAYDELSIFVRKLVGAFYISLDASRGPVSEVVRGTMQPGNLYIHFRPISQTNHHTCDIAQVSQTLDGMVKIQPECIRQRQFERFDEVSAAINLSIFKPMRSNLETRSVQATDDPTDLAFCDSILGRSISIVGTSNSPVATHHCRRLHGLLSRLEST